MNESEEALITFLEQQTTIFPVGAFYSIIPPENISILQQLGEPCFELYLSRLSFRSLDEHWTVLEVEQQDNYPTAPLLYLAPSAKTLIIPPIPSLPVELKQIELSENHRLLTGITHLGDYQILPLQRYHAAFAQDPTHATFCFTQLKLEAENAILKAYSTRILTSFRKREDFGRYYAQVKVLYFNQRLNGGRDFSHLKQRLLFPTLAPALEHSIIFDLDMTLSSSWAIEKYQTRQIEAWLQQTKILDLFEQGFFDPSICEKAIAFAQESTWEVEWDNSPYYARARRLKKSLPHSLKTLVATTLQGETIKVANQLRITSKGVQLGNKQASVLIEQIHRIRGGKVEFFNEPFMGNAVLHPFLASVTTEG